MDRDTRRLVCHLFAQATAVVEDAHQAAADGQSHQLTLSEYRACARRLRQLAQDAVALADAIAAITGKRPEES